MILKHIFLYLLTGNKELIVPLKPIHLYLMLFLILSAAGGCRMETKAPEHFHSHYLKYEIEYLEDMAGDIPTRILPSVFEAHYGEAHVYSRIRGFLNQFTLVQIADLKKRRVTTMLQFFGNKVYAVSSPGQLPAGIVSPGKLRYRRTGYKEEIGGLTSEALEVHGPDGTFKIWYTREIPVHHPNLSTPYPSVKHPLTRFRVQLSQLKMQLQCTSYESREMPSEILEVPEDYKQVSHENMEEIINSLFTKE